jgi:hypothetical protein
VYTNDTAEDFARAPAAAINVSMALRSISWRFGPESAAVWMYASCASAAARYDFTEERSPSTGVTPRDASLSAACGVRTSAVI